MRPGRETIVSFDQSVSEHYTHGELLGTIKSAITKLGKTIDSVTVGDLAPVDEFHVGGRMATDNLLDQLNFFRTGPYPRCGLRTGRCFAEYCKQV